MKRLFWRTALAAAFLAPVPALSAGPAAKAGDVRPGLPGKFVWFDLLSKDRAASAAFYKGLFGWTFESRPGRAVPFEVISANGVQIGGLLDMTASKEQLPESIWLSYVSVSDVDASAAAFLSKKGKVLKEPHDVTKAARAAVVADAQGALLGLVKAAKGDPPDAPAAEGTFLWTEYIAQDAETAMVFYRETLGYEDKRMDAGVDIPYWVLAKGGVNRAGLYKTPWKEVKSNWLPYVRVADAAAAAAKAVALGGRVALAPRPDVRNGSLAIIVDPTGAALALQQWPFEKAGK
jgi:hypothetical protein